MNVFSSDGFLSAVVEARFRRRESRIIERWVGGRAYRLLEVDGEPVTSIPFVDFLEPVRAPGDHTEKLRYLPAASWRRVPSRGAWEALRAGPDVPLGVAPFVDWRRLDSPGAFEAHVDGRSRGARRSLSRSRRRMERRWGELRVEHGSLDSSLLERCLALKSAQYRATGVLDVLASPSTRRLFHVLLEQQGLVLSALHAGDQVAAIHAGLFHRGRFYYWVPAYEPRFQSDSPGRVLLDGLLSFSRAAGHEEFDFLTGSERYKWHYANGGRLVEPDGQPRMGLRMWQQARASVMPSVRRHPKLHSVLQSGKRLMERATL